MEKKLSSKPMQAILYQLARYSDIHIIQFDEDTIVNKAIEEWPKVEVIIAFYSTGFPIDKCIRYINKYKPIQINDMES